MASTSFAQAPSLFRRKDVEYRLRQLEELHVRRIAGRCEGALGRMRGRSQLKVRLGLRLEGSCGLIV